MTPTPSEADRKCAASVYECRDYDGDGRLLLEDAATLIAARVDEAVALYSEAVEKAHAALDADPTMTPRSVSHGGLAVRIEKLSRNRATREHERDELRKALEAYREAYAPDGHSSPHDCFATGPLTGNAVVDYIQCPGCHAEKLYLAATKGGAS